MGNFGLVKNYRTDDALRKSFNKLVTDTFGFDFEDWYQNGFWGENYIPYSMVVGEDIVANVSVNITDIVWKGEKHHFIQLGTVMTAQKYRNQGLIRKLMEEVEKDFGGKVDGVYLFANDSVVDFYPKFGFSKAKEYKYSKAVKVENHKTAVQFSMNSKEQWSQLVNAINRSAVQGDFEMTDNSGLIMFYVSSFMQSSVHYDKKLDAYVIADVEDGKLFIHNVFAKDEVDLDEVIKAFGKEIKEVELGFVPKNKDGYSVEELHEEDTTLFVKGNAFSDFDSNKLMFPTLAHA